MVLWLQGIDKAGVIGIIGLIIWHGREGHTVPANRILPARNVAPPRLRKRPNRVWVVGVVHKNKKFSQNFLASPFLSVALLHGCWDGNIPPASPTFVYHNSPVLF